MPKRANFSLYWILMIGQIRPFPSSLVFVSTQVYPSTYFTVYYITHKCQQEGVVIHLMCCPVLPHIICNCIASLYMLLVSKIISSVGQPEGIFKKLNGSSQDAVKSGCTHLGFPPPPKKIFGGRHLEIAPSKQIFFWGGNLCISHQLVKNQT